MAADQDLWGSPREDPDSVVWAVRVRDLEERAGRGLASFELSALAEAIGQSSIPEALDTIVEGVVGVDDEPDEYVVQVYDAGRFLIAAPALVLQTGVPVADVPDDPVERQAFVLEVAEQAVVDEGLDYAVSGVVVAPDGARVYVRPL